MNKDNPVPSLDKEELAMFSTLVKMNMMQIPLEEEVGGAKAELIRNIYRV